MILIAGGTGRLGTQLVTRLAARGLEVRVLTRDPSRAHHLAGIASEIVEGDVRDRATLARAVQGATTVVSAVHGFAGPGRVSPESVDRDGNANLVGAALTVDAEVILMSVLGASPEHPMELFRAKWAAEQQLRASGVRWTIVRAAAYVELWAEIMAKPIVFGRGENPINFVSVGDVAAGVERAVIDTALRGSVIEIGGPQNVTFNELAELLQRTRGGSSPIRHVPRWLLRSAAPFARQPRAALAMDSVDMTFDAASARRFADLPVTDLETALTQAIG
jgi:NADH dehydrogenase